MKELSIEEKAKAYDEALEQARKELKTCGSQDCDAARQIFRFFPELKESEEEGMRKRLLNWFKGCNWDTIDNGTLKRDDIIAWLENLEKQKELKPIEQKATWSEEDERHKNTIIRAIHGACNITPIEGELAEKWLTSLKKRYTWKPTDEQMEAVKCAALDVSKFSSRSEQLMLDNGPYYKALDSLYQDLKKL